MKAFLAELKKKAVLGIVGGSNYEKMEEQMDGAGCKLEGCVPTLHIICTTACVAAHHIYYCLCGCTSYILLPVWLHIIYTTACVAVVGNSDCNNMFPPPPLHFPPPPLCSHRDV